MPEQYIPFIHRGLVTNVEPAKLAPGQFPGIVNMFVPQEGALATRPGRKFAGSSSGLQTDPVRIQKLVVSEGENPYIPGQGPNGTFAAGTQNLRYVQGNRSGVIDLLRTPDYSTGSLALVASGISSVNNAIQKRFNLSAYSAGATGNPWAFIASEVSMLKDQGVAPYSTLRNWGILPAYGVATAALGAAGNLDGGAAGSPNGSSGYDYIYTYVAGDTNNEGNPSQLMKADSAVANGAPLAVHLAQITVTVFGTDDPQITSVNIYRRGGTYSDGLYRFVGTVTNPGLNGVTHVPNSTTFSDNLGDADIVNAPTVEFDNDPPVSSTVPTPFVTTVQLGPTGTGFVTATLNSAPSWQIQPGTKIHFQNEDAIVVYHQLASDQVKIYCQYSHSTGEPAEIDVITNQACHLTLAAFDSIFVAGDPNNPHVLYQSKTGRPESFPVIDSLGNSHQLNVGTPANGIINMTEFRGTVLCMNQSSLFEVLVYNNVMVAATEIPGSRGLVSPYAWCKVDNEIWFLSTDGVYSWDGGSIKKRSGPVDRIFHNYQTGTVPPLDYNHARLQYSTMEHVRNEVRLIYLDIGGIEWILVCQPGMAPDGGDRWYHYQADITVSGTAQHVVCMYREPDTGSTIYARQDPVLGGVFSLEDQVVLKFPLPDGQPVNATNDEYVSDPTTSGTPISFDFWTPCYDLGAPFNKKLFEEVLLDMDPQSAMGSVAINCDVYLDYRPTVTDHYLIEAPFNEPQGRQPVSLLPALQSLTGLQSFGRTARAIQFHFYGSTSQAPLTFYGLTFRYQDLGSLTAGMSTDWDNRGTEHDKKFFQMTVTFDTNGQDQTLILDTLTGPNGKTYTQDVQEFVISNPVGVPGSTTVSRTFAMQSAGGGGIIAKAVRLRAKAAGSNTQASTSQQFIIRNVSYEIEQFPPDVVSQTEWDDGGYSYLKYANQVVLEVNTNGVTVNVSLQADGVDKYDFTVASTEQDRNRFFTVPAGLTGYRWRLFCDPTQNAIANLGGMFQLFNHAVKMQQADQGEVVHTTDWRDGGWPHDKRLSVVNLQFDNTGGADVVLQMDLLNGINGSVQVPNVATFDLGAGTGRTQRAVALADGLIAKKYRVYPRGNTIPAGLKSWDYTVEFEKFPPDSVDFTEPKDFGWPYDKTGRNLILKIDTGGVACSIQPMADGQNAGTALSVTTTLDDWQRVLPLSSGLIGKLWKLRLTPGTNGKAQLFDWTLDFVKEPAAVNSIDTLESDFGYVGWKFLKEGWFDYVCTQTITVTVLVDGGLTFFSTTLPAHTARDVERFFFPAMNTNTNVLNKSRKYRAQVTSAAPIRLYSNSRIDWNAWNGQQRASFQGFPVNPEQQLPV